MLVVVVRSKHETRTFEYDQPVITVGRGEFNDIVLPTAKVSKRHARLEVSTHGLVLTDIKSTNGTYLNGRRVMAAVLVGEGDHIHVGEFTIELKSASGLPSSAGRAGFTPLAQASADTEPQPEATATQAAEDAGTRRGAAYRMAWLDEWATPSSQRSAGGTPRMLRGAQMIEGHRRESTLAFTVYASLGGLLPVGQGTSLRVWADARATVKDGTGSKPRISVALEIFLSLPDGKLEAPITDQGILQVTQGGQSADLLLPLRMREVGPARIELAVCHRGARLATLILRPEVRALSITELGELSPHNEILVSAQAESVPPASSPQVTLRLREYGPLAELPQSEPPGPMTGSHAGDSRTHRRLKVELSLLHEETSEVVANGDVQLELSLSDCMRTFLASQAVEKVALAADNGRESALQSVGEALANMLLPATVREALAGVLPGAWLAIDSVESWTPWELVRVSRGLTSYYLGERFALSRSGTGSSTCRFVSTPRVLVTPSSVEALSRREQQALASLDVRLRQCNRLAEVLPLLQQAGVAAWHFTGHGGFDRADKSGASLRLDDGVLTPVQIMPVNRARKSGQSPPFAGSFVFLATSEPTAPTTPLAPAGTAQWIERFLQAGVGAIIATQWPVSSAKCGQFAESFYRAWGSNRPLAIAAAEAREAIRTDGDPSWMAFVVYGIPGARLGGI